MNDLLIALLIGIIAGIIDIIPMIIQKIEKSASISAFFHYLVLGLIIPFVNWDMQPWLKGLLIAELSAIPVLILVYPNDKKSLIPIVLFAAILGAGIGVAGSILI
ncbi:MAG: hypothetical protein PF517_16480 [Salinivirgaceae bacterium]|jgi:hypothetical protein|nr:hypothetical protein [Salinivirgaceae bacterium]